ncbi:DALR anticodon-binding domain-containing protein [Sneathiella glossodoripedis]|uniref:DALR anticodon-binding domain-containing protein n=1 Tax=Sneathiella glossodoripedis TaxID=418853 RepID=UPI0004713B98|nr:DALR anticodon-binding domain-containing protein [Sneathiella glossodoripedis]
MQADLIVSALRSLECVDTAQLADNGYINITLAVDTLSGDLLKIEESGCSYGLQGLDAHCNSVTLSSPQSRDDLLALRQAYNVTYLEKIARMAKVDVESGVWQEPELRGYPSATALAKCGEDVLKLSLLGNGTDFAVHFSPVLACDRSYDNPAFCVPYAEARIGQILRDQSVKDVSDADTELLLHTVDHTALEGAQERKLMMHLLNWPLCVRQSLREGDMVHLVSFLSELSLLFFRLNEHRRLQSSDYLHHKVYKTARLQLLRASRKLLSGGLDLMEVNRAEEFI